MERQCLICGESHRDSPQIKHCLSIKNIILSFFLSLYFVYHVYILLIILHFLSIFTITKSQKNECPKMHIFNRKTIRPKASGCTRFWDFFFRDSQNGSVVFTRCLRDAYESLAQLNRIPQNTGYLWNILAHISRVWYSNLLSVDFQPFISRILANRLHFQSKTISPSDASVHLQEVCLWHAIMIG